MSSPILQSYLSSQFADIDWQAPWLAHLCQLSYLSTQVQRLSKKNHGFESENNKVVADLLNTAMIQRSNNSQNHAPKTKSIKDNQACNLEFVAQDALPEGIGYEQFIGSTGNIPTRNNLHDLFNGSIWLTFPKTKAMLNYHHMLEIAKYTETQDKQKIRGRVRDTITVFDENGAVLVITDASIGEALVNFDWQTSLVQSRSRWSDPFELNLDNRSEAQVAVYIFGHALLEQLIQPRKALCAHSVVINVSQDFFSLSTAERILYLDNKLAEYMSHLLVQDSVTPRQLAPLPILGVPHFWSKNSDVSFYDDPYVFRSGRRKK